MPCYFTSGAFLSSQEFAVIVDSEGSTAGSALCLKAATANHSCAPNAVQTFDGRVLSLRGIGPIMKGEEVTVAFIRLHHHSAARQQSLRESYVFECRCDRCDSEEVDTEDARLTGYACPDKPCPGVCANHGLASSRERSPSAADGQEASSAVNTLSGAHDPGCLLCSTCGAARSAEDTETESRAIDKLLKQVASLAGSGGKGLERKLILEEALQRGTDFLHRGNWMLSDILYPLTMQCMAIQVRHAASTTTYSRVRGSNITHPPVSARLTCSAVLHTALVSKVFCDIIIRSFV